MVCLALLGLAQAQEVPNWSFETGDLTGWSGFTGGGWFGSASVVQGWNSGGAPAFPDGDHVLTLNDASGACSDLFVVTRTRVTVQHARSVLTAGGVDLRVEPDGGVSGPLEVTSPGAQGSYATATVDVDDICGLSASVCVESPGGRHWLDLFTLTGPGCGPWVDGDGDGVCVTGLDLDGDGACSDVGEYDLPDTDCDDTNPQITPGRDDIPGNGIDEDCDGVDADPGEADTDTDTDTDTDADVDADTDSDVDADTDADADIGPVVDEALRVRSACATSSAPASLIAFALAVLAVRRRS